MAKRHRLGPRIVAAAEARARYRDAHCFIGGTGAVGGTAVLKLIELYETMFSITPPDGEEIPIVVATGRTRDDIHAFTKRLFDWQRARHGSADACMRLSSGYVTYGGVFVKLERLPLELVPDLPDLAHSDDAARTAAAREYISDLGRDPDDLDGVVGLLHHLIGEAPPPCSTFLADYRQAHLLDKGIERFRSVVFGVPIPSLIAYSRGLEQVIAALAPDGKVPPGVADGLKKAFADKLLADLRGVRADHAERLVVAHTTGVGGMYDIDAHGGIAPRLGFAHSGNDAALAEKHRQAEALTEQYTAIGADVLVPAAAIGVDEVRVREPLPLKKTIRDQLFTTAHSMLPNARTEDRAKNRPADGGRHTPAKLNLKAYPPVTLRLDGEPSDPVQFPPGADIVPAYALRSGENGFFTAANADALYRVMRVASTSELGATLANVVLLGDDPVDPWFKRSDGQPGGVCVYTETDNSRYVFDFLQQPVLRSMNLSGLDPLALQDLGSAKHQAELHTTALLILRHRLRTLDLDALDPYVDLSPAEAETFFHSHSKALTFEDILSWDVRDVSDDLRLMVTAREPDALKPLLSYGAAKAHFAKWESGVTRILSRVLHALWSITSIGSPILYEDAGTDYAVAGPYVAPFEIVTATRASLGEAFAAGHRQHGGRGDLRDYRDWAIAALGFIDIRPHAMLAKTLAPAPGCDFAAEVARCATMDELLGEIRSLTRFTPFTTCGLLAVLTRLRGLYKLLSASMLHLGSLQDFAWSMPRDATGHIVVDPGVVEALRMVAEGLEKATGTEVLDGVWGYEPLPVQDRRAAVLAASRS